MPKSVGGWLQEEEEEEEEREELVQFIIHGNTYKIKHDLGDMIDDIHRLRGNCPEAIVYISLYNTFMLSERQKHPSTRQRKGA